MKNTFKIILSSLILGIYLLFAVATSIDQPITFTIDGNIVNISDTCDISSMQFIFAVSPTNDDTIPIFPSTISTGDTAFILIDALPYHTLLYSCSCGDTIFSQTVPFVQGPTSTFPTIDAGCN